MLLYEEKNIIYDYRFYLEKGEYIYFLVEIFGLYWIEWCYVVKLFIFWKKENDMLKEKLI